MLYFIYILGLLTICQAAPIDKEEQSETWNPETSGEYGNLYEGDIMLIKTRNGITSSTSLWANGQIPYTIDSSVDSTGRVVLQRAFDYYRANTCIRLVPRSRESNYLVFKTPSGGCNSYVGRTNRGAQTVNLAKGCFGRLGTVLHEIMHAIGFWHEHSREDRDNYVTILWENIQEQYKYAFDKKTGSATFGTSYDSGSVMQYTAKSFSSNGKYTITPKSGSPSDLGQRTKLSVNDIKKIQRMYGCDPAWPQTYKGIPITSFTKLIPPKTHEPTTSSPATTIKPTDETVVQKSCSFLTTSRKCGFTQDTNRNNFDWTFNTGSTPTKGTGPSKGYGKKPGYYWYAEADGHVSQTSRLLGPVIPVGSQGLSCMIYRTYMYGNTMGTLKIKLQDTSLGSNAFRLERTLQMISGKQKDRWNKYTVHMTGLNPSIQYRVVFEAVIGPGVYSDIAIDQVKFRSSDDC